MTLNLKSIYKSPKVKGIREFLHTFSNEDIFSLAQTASSKKIFPENREEAVDTILIYTPELERFFSYRRITNELLSQYLHRNHVSLKGHATRNQLIVKVIKLWDIKIQDAFEHTTPIRRQGDQLRCQTRIPTSSNNSTDLDVNNEAETRTSVIKSDIFARDFVEWFYSCLNNVHYSSSPQQGNNLCSSMFCSNASVDLFMLSRDSTKEIHAEGDEDCEKELREVIQSHGLRFSPNLETGTQALKSAHGLIKVLACGSLHKTDSFIGVFEQEFGLVQSPKDKNWKIFYTKANFKSSVTDIPSLPPCSVFEIENA